MTDKLAIPTVHLNGTSKNALLEQISEAFAALNEASAKLAAACPNARDFYVQGTDGASGQAFVVAREQHRDRMLKLAAVIRELELIGEGIVDQ